MRKAIVILIVLILAGGTAFYFGWVQFRLPPGTVGVVFTKTSGWDSEVIDAGEFSWRWEALLPTNLTLHMVDIDPVTVGVSSTGNLPSGPLYGGFLEGSPTFEYEVRFDVTYRINPEELPRLLEEGVVEGSDVADWYDSMNDSIEAEALELVSEAMESVSETSAGERVSLFAESMEERLVGAVPDAEIVSVLPRRISLPDIGLYREARELYLGAMEVRGEAIEEAMASASTEEVFEEARLATLRRYGEVLSEYPVLLEYFSLGAEEGVDPLNLGRLRPEGAQEE
ncbi:MAG: hypothetical protein ACLFPV_01095 [Spirochaetaceae bacterium]